MKVIGWIIVLISSLVPRLFNDVHRKPGKIHHVRDIRWKGLGAVNTYTFDFYWEKCKGKTAGLGKLESLGTDMLAQAKMARNVSILATFKCCKCHAMSLPSYVTHVTNKFTRLPCFSVCIIEKLGGAWLQR